MYTVKPAVKTLKREQQKDVPELKQYSSLTFLIYLHVLVLFYIKLERLGASTGTEADGLNTGCVTLGAVGPPLLLCCVIHGNAPLNPSLTAHVLRWCHRCGQM